MRRIVLASLLALLCLTSTAEARLFWQTYGSVVASSDGCGCTWNWNQDYFVPRHADSCRYGLFSPCKTSCTTSPACKWCHPIYQGYCSPYGPWHYDRRNHIYQTYCGCEPVCVDGPYRANCCLGKGCFRHHFCGKGCLRNGSRGDGCCMQTDVCPNGMCEPRVETSFPLPNVEPPAFEVLGSIPDEGDSLLASASLTPSGNQAEQRVLLSPPGVDMQQLLPSLGIPQNSLPPQTLPAPE